MSADLSLRRRLLVLTEARYREADRGWSQAARAALRWFPPASRPAVLPIGDPGSRLRTLWEERERALLRLAAARLAFDRARTRHVARLRQVPARAVLRITAV